jgi:hypothetical protein
MCYDKLTWDDIQRMEDGRPPRPLTFTGEWLNEHFPNGMDEDDIAVMNMVMEKDMINRGLCPCCGQPRETETETEEYDDD